MNRREVLIGLGASGLAACSRTPVITLSQRTTATVQLNATPTGPALRSSFLGLSYASALLADASVFTSANTSLIALLRRLTPDGVLRLGGDSSEFGVWQRTSTALAAPFKHAITPAEIDRLADFVEACGWRVVYGINLGHGEPERAADEAAYLVQRLGDRLEALQIGNEPDLYTRNGLRPPNYDVGTYIDEWRRYARAIRTRTPNAPLSGPDVAYKAEWIDAFTRACGNEVTFISDHYFATGPANYSSINVPALLLSERNRYMGLRATALSNASLDKPLRITEANAVYNDGKQYVSNSLGAALWATQLLFQMCRDRISGVNFHSGIDGFYTPISRSTDGSAWNPQPLYYAMLMFAQVAPATFVDAITKTGNSLLRAHGLIGQDGKFKLLLINESAALAIDVQISAEQPIRQASSLQLSASDIWRTTGVTLGGSAVDSRGAWQPRPEMQSVEGGYANVTIPQASATLINLD